MTADWKYFKLEEFSCHHCGLNLIQPGLVDKLDQIRGELGFPLIVSSGYRCGIYNMQVAETGPQGPHTTGWAVDLKIRGAEARSLVQCALDHGFTGIGISQKGASRFIHLDLLTEAQGYPRPTIWSY